MNTLQCSLSTNDVANKITEIHIFLPHRQFLRPLTVIRQHHMAPVCFHQRVDFNLSEYYFVNTDPKEQTRREHQEGNSITLKKVIYKPVPTLWSRSRPFKVLRPSEHRNKLLKTYLVTTNNVVETVRVAEGVRHIWTKLTTDTAF